jgi:uncharacterized protein (TIGR03437 family)
VQVIGRTPEIAQAVWGAAGSLSRISGWGLADAGDTRGLEITVAASPAPVLGASSSEVLFQMPWDVARASDVHVPARVVLPSADDSPFELVAETSVRVYSFAPQFVNLSANFLLAVHEDWRALVSAEAPARPGEIVHLYGTGFGLVDIPQKTGTPASSSPAAFVVSMPDCEGTPVVFAGLAPGLVGLYQLSVRLPAGSPAGVLCLWPDKLDVAGGRIP